MSQESWHLGRSAILESPAGDYHSVYGASSLKRMNKIPPNSLSLWFSDRRFQDGGVKQQNHFADLICSISFRIRGRGLNPAPPQSEPAHYTASLSTPTSENSMAIETKALTILKNGERLFPKGSWGLWTKSGDNKASADETKASAPAPHRFVFYQNKKISIVFKYYKISVFWYDFIYNKL